MTCKNIIIYNTICLIYFFEVVHVLHILVHNHAECILSIHLNLLNRL